jgi:hypothetical protein
MGKKGDWVSVSVDLRAWEIDPILDDESSSGFKIAGGICPYEKTLVFQMKVWEPSGLHINTADLTIVVKVVADP